MGVLQIIKAISNTEGQPLIYLPLFVIVGISMIKDVFEDLKRHKSDHEENTRKTRRFEVDSFKENVLWRDIYIGDIIKIGSDEPIPADILIIKTSEPKGVCYVETKNLDGETNLKHKWAPKDLITEIPSEKEVKKNYLLLSN